jgi:hypothetical protein
MPAFSRPPGQLAPKSETDLLRQYLEKDHRYRHGQTDIKRRVIAAGFIPGEGHQLNQQNFSGALGNGSRWYGSQPDSLVEADLFQATTPAQWGFAVGYGGPSQISVYSVTNLPNPVRQPLVDFYMLDGSYFGEWNFDDNLLRGVLAMPKHGLASMWSRAIVWRLEELALGEPLSSAILTTANSPWFSQGTPVYFAVLGDPTLRLEVTPPPTKLTVARRQQQVRLNWGASPATNVTYDVFRRLQRVETPFQRLNANPIDGLAFTDSDPPSGAKLYQVRARSLVRTGSGSYTNLSQGVFVSVR